MRKVSPILIFSIYLIVILLAESALVPAILSIGLPEYEAQKVTYLFACGGLIVLFIYLRSETDRYAIFRTPTFKQALQSLLLAMLVTTGAFASIGVQTYLTAQFSPETAAGFWNFTGLDYSIEPRYEYLGRNSEALSLTLFFATQMLIMPLAEELYFRGLILEKYLGKLHSATAIFVTSFLFTLPHSINLYLSTFVFSVVVCWHFMRHRNIWLVFLLHALSNLMDWLLAGFGGVQYLESHSAEDLHRFSTWAPDILVATTCIALCCLQLCRASPATVSSNIRTKPWQSTLL